MAKFKLYEIPAGCIFTIEETPSYPKFKTSAGYVDMRDRIINKSGNCDGKECRLISIAEIAREFKITDEEAESLIKKFKSEYH